MEYSELFFLNWKIPCAYIYTILEIKKRQERFGVHGVMPPLDKSHYFFLHFGFALCELQYYVTVASDFNILKVPLSPSVKLQSSQSFGTHTLIRESFVVLSFLFSLLRLNL